MVTNHHLPHDHPSVQEAFSILGLEWADPAPAPMPLPIEALPGDEVWQRHTTGGDPDPATPWGAACIWWQGLADPQEYLHALQLMSSNPEVWGDYTEAAAAIADLGILTKVEDNAERDDIKYVRFIEYAGAEAGRIFAETPLTDVWIVTLVKREGDAWWRVWGLSHNYFPPAADVIA